MSAWTAAAARSVAARRLRRAAAGAPPGPLHDHLSDPLPMPTAPHTTARLLAVDLETTGLDPRTDRIVSIGWVPVDGDRIDLAGARRRVVRTPGINGSVTVHGLTDDDVAGGVHPGEALDALLVALRGRLLLAHHASVERRFLGAACRDLLGAELLTPTVDTRSLARRLGGSTWEGEPDPGRLRLDAVRARYGLPRYRSHEALTDALACAELYLALVAEVGADDPVPLHRLVDRWA